MAISVTERGATVTNADSATFDVASVALTNGRVYVAFLYTSIASGTAPTGSSVQVQSGTGTLTMTKYSTTGDSEAFSGGVRRVEAWYGKCTESGTATMRATVSATSTNTCLIIYELDGVDTGGTNGINAISEGKCSTNGSTSTTSLQTELDSVATDNRPIAFCVHRANEATTHDSGGGYTELRDTAHNSPSGGVCVQWHSSSNDTTPDFSWTTSSANGGIALELVAAATGTTVEVPTATLSDTQFAPTIAHGIVVPVKALSDTQFAPQANLAVIPPNATLSDTQFAPTVVNPAGVVVPVTTLSDTQFAPQVNLKVIVPPVSDTAISGLAPTVNIGANVIVPTATLSDTQFAPQVNLAVIVPTRALDDRGWEPQVNLAVIVPTRALDDRGWEPSVNIGVNITVPNATLAMTSFAPTVVNPKSVTVPNAALSDTQFAPQLRLAVIVPTRSLTTTGFAPTVIVGALVVPPAAALGSTAFAPTVSIAVSATIIVPTVALRIFAHAPDVLATKRQPERPRRLRQWWETMPIVNPMRNLRRRL